MSSHHIVREKQEPALYIHQIDHFDEEYLGQLLEWSPTLLVSANAYEKTLSLGLKVDVVIGDVTNLSLQENTKAIFEATESVQTAVKYLIAEQYPAVNIIADEAKFDELTDFFPQINMVLFTPTSKSYPIKTGFKVWKPAGTIFKINSSSHFETTNLRQSENEDFVVLKDGFVSFEFNADYLFLTELL
jgi:hypothetical protein